MIKNATIIVVSFIFMLSLGFVSFAYNVEWRSLSIGFLNGQNAAHWSSFPIRYIIRSDQIPQDWRDSVRRIMGEWAYPTNRDESNIVWWNLQSETARWRPSQDGDNHVTWIWQRDNYRDVRGVDDATAAMILATTRRYYDWLSPWHIVESDLFFNAAYFSWTTNVANVCGASNTFLVQRVALHELGHMIGLEHSDVGTAIMARTAGCNDTRQILESDDINGLDYLYESDDPIHAYDPW